MKLSEIRILENKENVPQAPEGKVVIAWYESQDGASFRRFLTMNGWKDRLLAAVGPLADMKGAENIRLKTYEKRYGSAPTMVVISHEQWIRGGRNGSRADHFVRKVPIENANQVYVVDLESFLKKYREVLEEVQKRIGVKKSQEEEEKSRKTRIAEHVERMKIRYPNLHIEAGYNNEVTISNERYGDRKITYYPLSSDGGKMTVQLPQSLLLRMIPFIRPEQNEPAQIE